MARGGNLAAAQQLSLAAFLTLGLAPLPARTRAVDGGRLGVVVLHLGVTVLRRADVGQWPGVIVAKAFSAQTLRHSLGRDGRSLRGTFHLDVEQEADRLFFQCVEHAGEHVIALTLVLHQRVALRHRPQTDALLEVVHLVEVLAPLAVEDG